MEKSSDSTKTVVLLTFCFLGNALLMSLVAQWHLFTSPLPPQSDYSCLLDQTQALVESLILLFPVWLVASCTLRFFRRTSLVLGCLALNAMAILYYSDLASYAVLGDRVWSSKTLGTLASVLPWVCDYASLLDYSPVWKLLGLHALLQIVLLALAWLYVRKRAASLEKRRSWSTALVLGAVLVLPLCLKQIQFGGVLSDIRTNQERHPLSLLIPAQKELREYSLGPEQDLQSLTYQIGLRHQDRDKIRDYRNLQVTKVAEGKKPDVLLILCDSLRYDSLSATDSPHLWELQKQSWVSPLHLSTGNSTGESFWGLFTGLDGHFRPKDYRDLPPALPKLMREAGYFNVFLGTGAFEFRNMNDFVNSQWFDLFDARGDLEYYVRDQQYVAKAESILRTRDLPGLGEKPIFMILYLYTNHVEYRVPESEEVFAPIFQEKRLPMPPWGPEILHLIKNRYRNTVHFVDKIISPLLRDQQITLVLGDHGESLGEDGTFLHGSRLSKIQICTPLICHLPGDAGGVLPGPTSHLDILPTLLDYLGVEVNTPQALQGISWRSGKLPEPRALLVTGLGCPEFGQEYVLFGSNLRQRGNGFTYSITMKPGMMKFYHGLLGEQAQPLSDSEEIRAGFLVDLQRWANNAYAGKAGRLPDECAPTLVQSLETEDNDAVRCMTFKALGHMTSRADIVIPCLEKQVRQAPSIPIRQAAQEALETVKMLRKGDF